jgi:hypothetical protein
MTTVVDKTSGLITDYTNKENIEKIVERGPLSSISVRNKTRIDLVVSDLRAWSQMDVYKREDIPDYLGVKNSDLILDILLVSKGTSLIDSDWRFPNDPNDPIYLPRAGKESFLMFEATY